MDRAALAHYRIRALRWAYEVLQQPLVVLDTETTGLGQRDQVVQIAVIDHTGEPLLESLIKPSMPISRDASRVHGITSDMVRDAPSFPEIYPQLVAVLAGHTIIAYNASFDRQMLNQTCWAYELKEFPRRPWQCAMLRFAEYYGQWHPARQAFKWQKLADACAFLDIPGTGAHSALGDARMTLRLVQRMAELYTGEK
ncbi:MAG: DNA polymerase III subunit epsilon [Anaerolineae bacterium]|nr:MAG: DNA polymerase III subunit epsilon [Anaerolineae bacterium]